jgi:hypothetical protein
MSQTHCLLAHFQRLATVAFIGLATASLLTLTGCDSGDEGDSGDLGALPAGTLGASCSSHSGCNAQLVCVASACQPAFPRTYVFTFGSAKIETTKADGSAWDALGGAPDVFAALIVDGEIVCTTETAQDSFDPLWNESCEAEVFQTTEVIVALLDDDLTVSDPVGSVTAGVPMCDSCIKSGQMNVSSPETIAEWFVGLALK